MLLAELHGKIPSKLENSEDLLTSNVFSFFKYSNRAIFQQYLKQLGLGVTFEDAENAEFIFWQNYEDRTEPDLVVICGKYYILFEAKLFSDFAPKNSTSDAQIDREVKMGSLESKNLIKDFVYVAITAEYYKDAKKYSTLENADFKFIWTNWQRVAYFLETLIEDNSLFAQSYTLDLYNLLLKKRLRSFKSISDIRSSSNFVFSDPIFYNKNTSKYKGEFSGFIEVLGDFDVILNYNKFYKKFFFNTSTEYKEYKCQNIFYYEKPTNRK